MTRIHPFLPALLAVLLAPACGADSTATTGFTGVTEAVTTTSGPGEPSTDTGADTGTGAAPTTGTAPTGDATSTGPVGETGDASTGDTSTGDTGTGDTGTTADPLATSTGDTSTGDASTGDDGGDTIYAIQKGTIAEASLVMVQGVIVTAVAPDLGGLFAQEPDGGEYSGIWVAVGGGQNIAKLVVGDEVDVTGTTVELAGRTTIDATAGSVTPTGVKGLVVAPEPLPSAVFSKPVLAEPWESVLIRITGAPLAVVGNLQGGEFKLVDQGVALAVDDFLFNVPANPVAFPGFGPGATFTQIAGVLNADGELDVYKLAPRRVDDLAGYKKP
jgi:predicted extracellular nuclease